MNFSKAKGLSSFGKRVWVFSAILQDLTNMLLFRSFTVQAGVINNGMPAVVLSIKRLFGRNEIIGMDMRSFLDMVKHIAGDEQTDYTSEGFNVQSFFANKATQKVAMDRFTIPSWAFPRAELDMFKCATLIIETATRFDSTIDKVAKVMLEAGVPEAEVEKFTNNVRGSKHENDSTQTPPTLH